MASVPSATQPVRAVVWGLHLALPLLGLWLLLARPELDIWWDHRPTHFWLIIAVAAVSFAIGMLISEASRARGDARLFLVSLAFLSSAGFFLLHGLATPGVLGQEENLGFELAQPVGLTITAVLAFVSSLPIRPGVLRYQAPLRGGLGVLLAAWALAWVLRLPPLSDPPPPSAEGGYLALALPALALYVIAAIRFFRLHRRRPSAMLISIVTAYALLAEAMLAGALAKNWHLSWWEWHLLLTFAFVFVAYSAYIQFRREGSSAGLFDAMTLSQTARRIRDEYTAALENVVSHLRNRPGTPGAAAAAERFGLTEGQAAVLDRAGQALASERELSERLSALVDVGTRARVGLAEGELLHEAMEQARKAYGPLLVGLVSEGTLRLGEESYGVRDLEGGPIERDGAAIYPLTVKGWVAGALRLAAPATEQQRALNQTLAAQVSIMLENARLYGELSTLFRQYMSPDVAASLLADPDQARLGGSLVEVTSLFGDLKGFTTFSEKASPGQIVKMLNAYHSAAVPCVLGNGGTIVQFVGDALLALFNAPARQDAHALHACRAALAMQRAAEHVGRGTDWPRWRVGVNTGIALVGNIGSPELRGFNAMGDAVNVAARLQAMARPGQVVIGPVTRELIGEEATVTSLGAQSLKGRREAVETYVLEAL